MDNKPDETSAESLDSLRSLGAISQAEYRARHAALPNEDCVPPILIEQPRFPWAFSGTLATLWVLFYLIPHRVMDRLDDIFRQLGGDLPVFTRYMLNANFFFYHRATGLLLQLIGLIVLILIYMKLPRRGPARLILILALAIGAPIIWRAAMELPLFVVPKLTK